MAIPRASSGMLRSQIRPASRAAAPLRQHARSKTTIQGKDDLGGPGGQEPRPSAPAGPDAIKRNWPAIGGVALVAVGAFTYFSTGGPSKAEQERMKIKAQGEMQNLKERGEQGLDKVKEVGEDVKAKGEEMVKGEGEVVSKKGGFKGLG